MEDFERQCQQYATQSGSQISDDLKVGVVLANLDDGPVREPVSDTSLQIVNLIIASVRATQMHGRI